MKRMKRIIAILLMVLMVFDCVPAVALDGVLEGDDSETVIEEIVETGPDDKALDGTEDEPVSDTEGAADPNAGPEEAEEDTPAPEEGTTPAEEETEEEKTPAEEEPTEDETPADAEPSEEPVDSDDKTLENEGAVEPAEDPEVNPEEPGIEALMMLPMLTAVPNGAELTPEEQITETIKSLYNQDYFDKADPRPIELLTKRVKVNNQTPEELHAGDVVTYEIMLRYNPSPVWGQGVGYDTNRSIYDKYENNTVKVVLPNELLLVSASDGRTFTSAASETDGYTVYTFSLPDLDAPTQTQDLTFQVNVYIRGNGSDYSIAKYDEVLENSVSFSTEFVTLNKRYSETDTGYEIDHITQSVSKGLPAIETVSDDIWSIRKNVKSAVPARNENGEGGTVTVTYNINVGMTASGSDNLLGENNAAYTAPGRDAVETMKITEILKGFLSDSEGTAINTDELTLKSAAIAKVGGTPVAFSNNSDIVLVGEGADAALALNTVKLDGNGDNDTNDTDYDTVYAPTYTSYEVVAVYEIPESAIVEFFETENWAKFENEAVLNYTLADMTASEPIEATAETKTKLPKKDPAVIDISKMLINYLNVEAAYAGEYDPINFTVSSDSDFSLYTKENGVYTPAFTGETQYAVAAGKYYAVAGKTYAVEEAMTESQKKDMVLTAPTENGGVYSFAAEENSTYVAKFTNKELRGEIHVLKTDDRGNALSGVKFELRDSSGNAVKVNGAEYVLTNSNGTADFVKLPYGTYTLKELEGKDGYAKDAGASAGISFTINDNNRIVTAANNTIINKKLYADVKLTKMVGTSGTDFSAAPADFPGKFTLERKIGSEWVAATDRNGSSLGDKSLTNGVITATVNAFDEDGKTYTYRWHEVIPAGYYDPDHPTAADLYSEEFTLVDTIDNVDHARTTVTEKTLYNRQKASITVTKHFWDVNGSSTTLVESTGKTVNVTLWKKVGDGEPLKVETKALGSNTWNDLILYEGDTPVTYYVSEEDVEGYKLDTAGLTLETIGEKTYYKVVFADNASSASVTLNNVQQLVPVVIKKRNYYSQSTPMEGAKVTVYVGTDGGTAANDAKTGTDISDMEIPTTDLVVYLQPGTTYVVKETGLPANSTYESTEVGGENTNTLTTASVLTKGTIPVQTVTIYNRPQPLVKINKVDSVSSSTKLNGVQYKIYTYENGTYKPYPSEGEQLVLTSGNSTGISMPAGTYYAAEVSNTVPDGYLDPNKVPAEYVALDSGTYIDRTGSGEEGFLFAKFTVSGTNSEETFTFKNIKNIGSIKVTKYIDGVLKKNVSGFVIEAYSGDPAVLPATATVGNDGTATITGLPVYDASGNKITYTIKEAAIPDGLKDTYYQVDPDYSQTVELNPGNASVSVDTAGKDLIVDNGTFSEVTAKKQFYNAYLNYVMTGTGVKYIFAEGDHGVGFGLYEYSDKNGGTWTKIAGTLSDGTDCIKFKVRNDRRYAIVETAASSLDSLKYMKPYKLDASGNDTRREYVTVEFFPDSDLDKYNYQLVELGTDGVARQPGNIDLRSTPIVNHDEWVQFHITKYLDNDTNVDGTAIDNSKDSLYDNAIYYLYRKELTADELTAGTVTFIEPQKDTVENWELVGKYASGTFYNNQAERQPGVFETKADEHAGTNVVYMLMEKSAGPNGGRINPNFQYSFYYCDELSSFNATVVPMDEGGNSAVRTSSYKLNSLKEDELLNSHYIGDGKGVVMFSTLRLAKWADVSNDSSKSKYEALPNVSFEVYLDNKSDTLPKGTYLETLTVNMEKATYMGESATSESGKAIAQGAPYRLMITGTPQVYKLVNYIEDTTLNLSELGVTVTVLDDGTHNTNGYKVYGVPITLTELDPPTGFAPASEVYHTYLCFVCDPKINDFYSTHAYSDAYYVTENDTAEPIADGSSKPWYVNFTDSRKKDETSGKSLKISVGPADSTPGISRIVNYPSNTTMVDIFKYGYTPTDATIGMDSETLSFRLNSEDVAPLTGVSMYIQKKNSDGVYEDWDYSINDFVLSGEHSKSVFTTGTGGKYSFPSGLTPGLYRIYESSVGAGNDAYEIAYPSTSVGRVFEVKPGGRQTVTMYNPTKLGFTLTKQDASGNVLANIKFTLKSKGTYSSAISAGPYEASSAATSGIVEFKNITSGKYVLTETGANDAGYSVQYFDEWVAASGNDTLKALAGGTAYIGYKYGPNADSTDVVITSIKTLDNTDLIVKDAKLGGFTIEKVSSENSATKLKGAVFEVYYKLFPEWEGSITVPELENDGTGWTKKADYTTNADGKISLPKLTPGVYAVREKTAPAGYDIIDPGRVDYFVIDGGMKQTVTFAEGITPNANGATVTVKNVPKVPVTATKEVLYGQLEKPSWYYFTVKLYDSATSTTPIGTAHAVDSTPVQFFVDYDATTKVPVLLSKGKTYYVEETLMSKSKYQTKSYAFTNATEVSDGTAKRKAFTVGDGANSTTAVNIQLTNNYMVGEVYFDKVDLKDHSVKLHGAEFKVYALGSDGKPAATSCGTAAEIGDTGSYKAVIDLVKIDPATEVTYILKETKTPENYLPDEREMLRFKLSGNANKLDLRGSTNSGEYVTNNKGCVLTIEKFNNLHSVVADAENESALLAADGDATFILYHFNTAENAWEEANVSDKEQSTSGGKVSWLLVPGEKYAVAESEWNTGKYIGLEDFYLGDSCVTTESITVGIKTITNCVVIENTPEDDLTYKAYNIPTMKVKITKKDIGGSVGVVPYAEFKIYKLSEPLPNDKAEAAVVINSLTTADIVYSGQTGSKENSTAADTGYQDKSSRSSWTFWSGRDPKQNYVIVETKVGKLGSSTSGSDAYNTLNKDYKEVVWYQAIPAVAAPDVTAVDEFVLENVYSYVNADISKAVVNNSSAEAAAAEDTGNSAFGGKIASLLTGDRKVVFKVTPSVTGKNQMLSGYTIEDNGLTFKSGDKNVTDVEYKITSIEVGAASHEIAHFHNSVADDIISATVTWKSAAGGTSTSTIDSLAEAVTVSPASTFDAVSFTVDYYSNSVKATNSGYALGTNFTVAPVTVNMTVKSNVDPAAAVDEITKLTNTAKYTLTYPKWNSDGTLADNSPLTKNVSASIDVEKLKYPVVSIEKTADFTAQTVGKKITYTIKITNKSETEDFLNPVILDMLPTGMTYDGICPETVTGTRGTVFNVTSHSYKGKTNNIGGGELGDAETAVVYELKNGDGSKLLPAESVSITLSVTIEKSAVLYGSNSLNFAFLSSGTIGLRTKDNPNGYSFRVNTSGELAHSLSTECASLTPESNRPTAIEREAALHDVLGNYTTEKYVWIPAFTTVTVNAEDQTKLEKWISSDIDTGFENGDNYLARASRNKTEDSRNGWVDYRLCVQNGKDDDLKKGWVIGDPLPQPGDSFNSSWRVIFDDITSVKFADYESKDVTYTIYYYTGSGNAETAVNEAIHGKAEVEGGFLYKSAATLPEGWISKADFDAAGTDKTAIKAFIMVFDPDLVLESHESIFVTYHTLTDVYTIAEETAFNNIAFTNNTNRFYSNYYDSPFGIAQSNHVNAVMVPENVSVEGDLWIDADWDSLWIDPNWEGKQRTANRTDLDYMSYDIVKLLQNSISFSIEDLRKNGNDTLNDSTGTHDGVGESIKHFQFLQLSPAMKRGKDENPYTGGVLNVSALKGEDPSNYAVHAEISNYSNLNGIFTLTNRGAGYYYSDDPDSELGTGKPHSYDSNFIADTDAGTFKTLPFYLVSSDNVDKSKDIGFRMERDLVLTKVAADKTSVKVPGAEFSLYGPFEYKTGASSDLGSALKFKQADDFGDGNHTYIYDPNGTVDTLITDANGQITVIGLNWWKEYVVKETSASVGYKLEGATATAGTGTNITKRSDNQWVLNLPSTDKMIRTEIMEVSNIRETTAQFIISKAIKSADNNRTPAVGEFTFDLYDGEGIKIDGASKTNAADGTVTFDAITFSKEGTFYYTIKENVPADADKVAGITYSAEVINVIVNVVWSDTDQKLVAAATYKNGDTETAAPTITNDYSPESTSAQFTVEKFVKGNDRAKAGQATFKFTLTPTGAPEGVTLGSAVEKSIADKMVSGTDHSIGTVAFDEITYSKTGTYTYTLKETNAVAKGYSNDNTVYYIKVVVTDDGKGQLSAVTSYSNAEDGTYTEFIDTFTFAFTNTYDPSDVSITLKAAKTVEGLMPVDKTFTINAYTTSSDITFGSQSKYVEVGKALKTGEADFGTVTFSKAGTYFFYITEVNDATPGYQFDTTAKEYKPDSDTTVKGHKVVVTVVDNENGALEISKTTVDGTELSTGKNAPVVVIKNTYDAGSVKTQLGVVKNVTGNERAAAKQKTFKFTLVPVTAGAPMPSGTETDGTKVISIDDTTSLGKVGENSFGEITYKAAGTYNYTLKETSEAGSGYTNDTAVYYIRVVVENDVASGTLTAKVLKSTTGAEDSFTDVTTDPTFTFTNTYDPSDVSITLKATKTVEGAMPTDKTFTILASSDSTDAVLENTSKDVTIDKSSKAGEVDFGTVTFSKAGTYTFTVKEFARPAEGYNGYTFDTTDHKVIVVVTDNKNGALEISKTTVDGKELTTSKDAPVVAITNSYDAGTTDAVLSVSKKVTGNLRPADETFTFRLIALDGAPLPGGASGTTCDVIIVDDGDTADYTASAAFEKITFNAVGKYYYTLDEINADGKGFDCDDTVYDIMIDVTDLGGALKATVYKNEPVEGADNYAEKTDAFAYVNDYNPEDASVEIDITKAFDESGKDRKDAMKSFTFTLTPDSGEAKTVTISDSDGTTASFKDKIFTETYDEVGKHHFTLSEVNGGEAGYTYDSSVYDILVEVIDESGVLKASVYKKAHDAAETAEARLNTASYGAAIAAYDTDAKSTTAGVTFTNKYLPAATTVALPISKVFTADSDVRPLAKTFTFQIARAAGEEYESEPMPASAATTITAAAGSADAVTGGAFGEIEFTEKGTYVYEITEIAGSEPGYTYDNSTKYTVTIVVTDKDGALEAAATVDGLASGETMTFTNGYDPEDAAANLGVVKAFKNDHYSRTGNEQTFSFVLSSVDGAPMPAGAADGKKTIEITDVGTADFGTITYETIGTYNYKLAESEVTAAGYTDYDKSVYDVKVEVIDDNGVLKASIYKKLSTEESYGAAIAAYDVTAKMADADVTFTNDYTPQPVKVKFPVEKKLTGSYAPSEKEFEFVLTPKDGAPMPGAAETLTAKVLGAKTTEFDEIEFTELGTYSYVVSETKGSEAGYTYDESTHTYTVTVTDAAGELKASWKLDDSDETTAVFTNVYAPSAATLTIPVAKVVNGTDPAGDKAFTFTLTPSAPYAPMPAGGSSVTIMGSGSSAFGIMIFGSTGTYEYTIAETAGTESGYTYDDTVYTVTVEVSDAGGALDKKVTISGGDSVTFTNTFKLEPVTVTIPVSKVVDGEVPEGEDKTFAFDLDAVTSGAPMPAGSSVTITGSGSSAFGAIEYTEPGVYEYTISEQNTGEENYEYDTTVYDVTVTVTLAEGKLVANAAVSGGSAVFTNIYTPEEPEDTNTPTDPENPDEPDRPPYVPISTSPDDEPTGEFFIDDEGVPRAIFVNDEGEEYYLDDEGVPRAVWYMPKTGYGPNMDAVLIAIGLMALIVLIFTLRKKDKHQ